MNRSFLLFLPLLAFNLVFASSDSIGQAEGTLKGQNKFYKSPGKAMLLSAILPGAGQFYTENYLKGAIITVAWGALGFLSIREQKKATNALTSYDTINYIEHRDRRNNFLWWTAAVWVFSIADAYVSSHMYKFREQETLAQTKNLLRGKLTYNLGFGPELSINLTFQKFL